MTELYARVFPDERGWSWEVKNVAGRLIEAGYEDDLADAEGAADHAIGLERWRERIGHR